MFSLATLKVLSFPKVFNSLKIMCLCMYVWFFSIFVLFRVNIISYIVWVGIFHHFRKFVTIISSHILLLPHYLFLELPWYTFLTRSHDAFMNFIFFLYLILPFQDFQEKKKTFIKLSFSFLISLSVWLFSISLISVPSL